MNTLTERRLRARVPTKDAPTAGSGRTGEAGMEDVTGL